MKNKTLSIIILIAFLVCLGIAALNYFYENQISIKETSDKIWRGGIEMELKNLNHPENKINSDEADIYYYPLK